MLKQRNGNIKINLNLENHSEEHFAILLLILLLN